MEIEEDIYYYYFYMNDGSEIKFSRKEYKGYDAFLTLTAEKNGWLKFGDTYIRVENIKYVKVRTETQSKEHLKKMFNK